MVAKKLVAMQAEVDTSRLADPATPLKELLVAATAEAPGNGSRDG